jgi:ABC-type dipeptide/oligopeptide/nickel transport system permease subunit
MKLFRLDPITRRRIERFRRIKRGYYSLLILAGAIVLSIFAPYLAESRALFVWYEGRPYFPTFEFYDMDTFGQNPPPAWGMGDLETEYRRLKAEWATEKFLYAQEAAQSGGDPVRLAELAARFPNRGNFVLLPLIAWNPYENDFWTGEILPEINQLLEEGDFEGAEWLARRDGLEELSDLIATREILEILADPERAPTGNLMGAVRAGSIPSLVGLGEVPPTPPDWGRGHFLGTDSQGRDVA